MMVFIPRLFNFIRSYKFNSVLIRNFLLISLLLILPLSAISYIVYIHTQDTMNKQFCSTNTQVTYRARDIMDNIFGETINLDTNLTQRSGLHMFMETGDKEYLGDFSDTLTTFSNVDLYLSSIYLYSEKYDYIISNTNSGNLTWFPDKGWYDFYTGLTTGDVSVACREGDGNSPLMLSFVDPVYSYDNERLGCVVTNLDIAELSQTVEKKGNPLAQNIYIADKNGTIVYSHDQSKVLKNVRDLGELRDLQIPSQTEYTGIQKVNGEDAVVTILPSAYFGWSYISILPLNYFYDDFQDIKNFIIKLILLTISVGFVSAVVISIRSFMPLQNIISVLNNPGSWEDPGTDQAKRRNSSEIGYITGNIINTLNSNRALESELEERVKKLNQAQAAALQAQINPHFLYNTLEVINFKSIELLKGKNEVSSMLTKLANLFRLSLDMENYLVPLSQEVEHAKIYTEILEMRYVSMFHVQWDIDSGAEGYLVPKLCIQPLIENSIYHGIKPKLTEGHILIRIGINQDRLLEISVSDDGVGMSDAQVNELNRRLSEDTEFSSEHIGIKNVNHRIRLICGVQYGVTLESTEGVGTTARMELPLVQYSS